MKKSNNCKNPLKLTYTSDGYHEQTREFGYKVNKSGDQDGEYVSKEVADELLAACEWARAVFQRLADEGRYPEFMLANNGGNGTMPLVNAIKNATI